VVRASESAEEDAVVRSRRGKGQQAALRAAHEEWYAYTLVDVQLADPERTVYVCGKCNYQRSWLRKLEEQALATAQDFRSILRCGVTSLDAATELLGIGVYGEKIRGLEEANNEYTDTPKQRDPDEPPQKPARKNTAKGHCVPSISVAPAVVSTHSQRRAIDKAKGNTEVELEKKIKKASVRFSATKGGAESQRAKLKTSRGRLDAVLKRYK